jgi:hypothetical protein
MGTTGRRIACVCVLTTLAAAAALNGDAQTRQSAPAWKDLIKSGSSFGVLFDALEKPHGTIRPRGLYVVTFRPGERSWRASGPMHPDGYQVDIGYPAGNLCNPDDNVLCIWGAAFEFDDQGSVLVSTTRVGRLQQLTMRDRIMAGESFSVLLDGLTTNVGTIRAGGQYLVTFLPAQRAWKAEGQMHPSGFQSHVDPATSALCNPAEYALCIWGAAFRFDDAGQVTSDERGRVGKILR